MDGRDETVMGLKVGKSLRLALPSCSFAEGHLLIDNLEPQVGLPLERREVIDKSGRFLIVWVRGFNVPPMVRYLEGRGDGSTNTAPA